MNRRLSEHGDARDSRRRLGRLVAVTTKSSGVRTEESVLRRAVRANAPSEVGIEAEVGILVADGVLRAITEEKIVRRHVDAGEPPSAEVEEDRQCEVQRDERDHRRDDAEEEIPSSARPCRASYDGINYSVADVPGCSAASWRSAVRRSWSAAFTSRPRAGRSASAPERTFTCRSALPVPSSRPSGSRSDAPW